MENGVNGGGRTYATGLRKSCKIKIFPFPQVSRKDVGQNMLLLL